MDKNQEISTRNCRTRVYVDGFNLYYGVLKDNPSWRWLDLNRYFKRIRPDDQIEKVLYFSAEVEPHRKTSFKRERQQAYLHALRRCPSVEIILGNYQRRTVRCGASCRMEYNTAEEKKTDVNIAISMLHDAMSQHMDRLILVSGDSDMEPAIHYIRKHHPNIKVVVYIPRNENNCHDRNNRNYNRMGVQVKPLPLQEISRCQFPDPLVDKEGKAIHKPSAWL